MGLAGCLSGRGLDPVQMQAGQIPGNKGLHPRLLLGCGDSPQFGQPNGLITLTDLAKPSFLDTRFKIY